MNQKYFIVVTGDCYPEGDAGAVRTHSFAKIMQKIGYKPIVIGMGKNTGFSPDKYDNIDYYSLRYASNGLGARILGRVFFLSHLKKIVKQYSIDGIMIVSGDLRTFKFVKRYAVKYDLPLIYDSVEWYSPSEFARGEKDIRYILNNKINTEVVDTCYRVVAISSYLEKYFTSKNIPTIRIPVIMDMKQISFKTEKEDGIIRIVYAGSMGTKDRISNFIKALNTLGEKIIGNIRFDMFGITYQEYSVTYGEIREELLETVFFFHGRVSRKDVTEYLKKADFTVLIRPIEERYAKAGFPTKIVESLATGTAVIGNLSSDLALYLNEKNALVIDGSLESCKKVLDDLLSMKHEDIEEMRRAARETAELHFDLNNYLGEVKELLE